MIWQLAIGWCGLLFMVGTDLMLGSPSTASTLLGGVIAGFTIGVALAQATPREDA